MEEVVEEREMVQVVDSGEVASTDPYPTTLTALRISGLTILPYHHVGQLRG